MSKLYREMWGDIWKPSKERWTVLDRVNDQTGFKMASSVGGAVTGNRADFLLIDDANNVKDVESDLIREEANRWFREVVPTRINSAVDSRIIVIQHRTHEDDVSGTILDPKNGFADQYVKLVIPMEFDSTRVCVTVMGNRTWADPRALDEDGDLLEGEALDAADGILAWPELYPPEYVSKTEQQLGPYAYNGQFQQCPSPRGGGIFKTKWWRSWPEDFLPPEHTDMGYYKKAFPPMDYVVASLDPALTDKQQNAQSAMSVWGIWRSTNRGYVPPRNLIDDDDGMMRVRESETPKIMLRHAWQKRLELHGPPENRPPGISDAAWNGPEFMEMRRENWGLVEWVVETCRAHGVHDLLIENKGGAQHIVSELARMFSTEPWGVIEVDPRGFDKVARAHSVVHLFSNGVVWAPTHRQWCEDAIYEMAKFPKGKAVDLIDSMVYALAHLRDQRFALRLEEADEEFSSSFVYRRTESPLYPV